MATLKHLAREVKIDAEYGGVEPNPDFTPGHHPYKVTLTYQRRRLTVPFFMGPALEREPTAEDVLESLLLDASSADQSFEDWCDDYGCDTDSRKAEKIYRTVQQQTARLKRFLDDDYERFLYADR